MFRNRKASVRAQVEAIHRSQAVIEFELDGTIVTANDNFLQVMGYRLKEIKGEHHRIFAEDDYARIAEVVASSTQTVKRLGASSEQIGQIVETIDEIADQTNLLALNAAIEAARVTRGAASRS